MTQVSRHPSILGTTLGLEAHGNRLSPAGTRHAFLALMPPRARRFPVVSAAIVFASFGSVALAQTPLDGPHASSDSALDPHLASAPPVPSPPSTRHGLLVLPYLGLHSYQNVDMAAYSPGARFGALFGGRLSHWLSLNGELTVDVSDIPHAKPAMRESTA
jgi:hypothetical protein